MMQEVPLTVMLDRLEEWVKRGGTGSPPDDGRPRGWLVSDVEVVCSVLRRAMAPRQQGRSWSDVWDMFDHVKTGDSAELELTEDMMVPRLTRDQLKVLDVMSDGEWVPPLKQIAKECGLSQQYTRQIVRGFGDKGWTTDGPLFREDDGRLMGRGIWLNQKGQQMQDNARAVYAGMEI